MIQPFLFWDWRKYAETVGSTAASIGQPSTFWGYPLSTLKGKQVYALHAVKVYDNVNRTDFVRVDAGNRLGEVLGYNAKYKLLEVQRAPGKPQYIDAIEVVPDRKKMEKVEGVKIPIGPIEWAKDAVGKVGEGISGLAEGAKQAGQIPADVAKTIRVLIYLAGAALLAYAIIYLTKFAKS